jgi:hypothetical protein
MLFTKLKMLVVFVVAFAPLILGHGEAGEARQEQRKTGQRKSDTAVKGTLRSVDADKNTVTVTIHTFDRTTGDGTDTDRTFPLANNAKVLQDDVVSKLAELKKGFPVTLTVDGTNASSVSVDGGVTQGEFWSANLERNTILVLAGRNMQRRVYHLLKDTRVSSNDGAPIRVQDLKQGMKLLMTRSVEDENTVIRIQALPEAGKKAS